MTCEEAEIAIGMRQHGALAVEDTAVLEAHLSSCAECRAFAAISMKTEHAMQAKMMEEVGAIDWDNLNLRWKKLRHEQSQRMPRGIAAAVMVSLASGVIQDRTWLGIGLQVVIITLGIIGIFTWSARHTAEKEAAARQSQLELFVFFREQTERALRRYFVWQFLAPVFALTWALIGVYDLHFNGLTPESAFWFGLTAFFLFRGANCTRAYRRLKAETRELA